MKHKLTSIILLLTVLLIVSVSNSYAWLDCPFGKINDPYPGSCERYIDTNNDQICDHSQPEPEKNEEISKTDSKLDSTPLISNSKFWVTFLPLAIYFLIWFITFHTALNNKISIFSPRNFQFFWNFILLVAFMITSISSIWLFFGEQNRTLLLIHNYSGIVTVEIGFLHLIRRTSYFTYFFKLPPKS